MSETHALQLPLLAAEQAQKHVTVNEALTALDALVQLGVKDRSLSVPPASPAEGDRYIVGAGPTGAWAGHQGEIAAFADGAWSFHAPREGWRAWVDDENALLVYDGAAWADFSALITVLQNLALLGIGTTADAVNPFAAKLNKALWTAKTAAEGGDGDLRYTLNKETAADVLSILMQRGFSGRAELGLVGDDDLSLKVSPDGSSWVEALRIDRDDGTVIFDGALTAALFLIGLGAPRTNIANSTGAPQTPSFQKVATNGPNSSFAFIADSASVSVAPKLELCKSGAAGALAAVSATDRMGEYQFNANDGATYLAGALMRGQCDGVAIATGVISGRLEFHTNPGGNAVVERMRIDKDGNIGMGGANTVIDANRHFRLRSYTIATLPAASAAAGQMIWCSDLGGGGGQLNSDGTNWRRVSRGGRQAVASDAAFTLTTLTSAEEQRHTGALTADRVITLSATNAYSGARFRVTRTGGGAFNLDFGGLKNLATGTWAEAIYDGAAWYLAAFGML